MNIYLVGYRGTGKTSVAPLLATLLDGEWRAVDMDPMIEEEAEKSIAEIFQTEGEASFRDREEGLLHRLASENHLVVATGGGIVERPANRKLLKGQPVAWLEAPAPVIAARLERDATSRTRRPSLTTMTGLDEIRAVLERRAPLYGEVALWRIDANTHAPPAIADELEKLFRARFV